MGTFTTESAVTSLYPFF